LQSVMLKLGLKWLLDQWWPFSLCTASAFTTAICR
jgi:hypothetical protein